MCYPIIRVWLHFSWWCLKGLRNTINCKRYVCSNFENMFNSIRLHASFEILLNSRWRWFHVVCNVFPAATTAKVVNEIAVHSSATWLWMQQDLNTQCPHYQFLPVWVWMCFFVLMGEFGISPTYFLTTSLDFRSSNPMARSFRRRRTERWQSVGCLAAPLITLQMLHLLCLFIPTLQPFDLFGSNYALIQNWFRVPKELGWQSRTGSYAGFFHQADGVPTVI